MTLLKNQAIQTALTGDFKNAISLNKSLLEENPNDIDALNRLALAYMLTGKLPDAKRTYQKVLDMDPLNTIALRNLKRLKEKGVKSEGFTGISHINNNFLEQTGKTKIVELVNLAQPQILQALRTGQDVSLSIKRLKIFVIVGEKQYIGVLPDDIGKRLIKLMKSGNHYQAYIKSADARHAVVFVKETKRSARYKDQPSFINTHDASSIFDRNGKIKKQMEKKEEEEEDYSEEEEA